MIRILLLVIFCTIYNISGAISIKTITYLGRDHYKVTTERATYYYDPVAGGFSSIVDSEDNDWISYKDQPWGDYPQSAGSAFRGLPNLVHGGDEAGAGHPGHKKCRSSVINNTITSTSISRQWEWKWIFEEDKAILEIIKVPSDHAYWFLYEGIPGGQYEPDKIYWGNDINGSSYTTYDHYKGEKHFANYQWMYFGHKEVKRCFVMVQVTEDTHSDHYSILGNTESGIDSPDGMVVAGFGRTDPATPLLTTPMKFVIMFYEEKVDSNIEYRRLKRYVMREGIRRIRKR